MARARNIKPGFFKNEDLAECSVWARLLFPGLWMLADREGRIEDRPKRIKGEIFPFDAVEVEPLLLELVQWGFIRRYQADAKKCIQINNFAIHQCPHATEKDSDLPDESGWYTVNERAKNGCITGKTSKKMGSSVQETVNPPLVNSETTVNPPSDNALNPDSLNPDSLNPESIRDDDTTAPPPSREAAVCVVVKAAGIGLVNPGHPVLAELLADGATVQNFEDAARIAVENGKGFAYALGVAKGIRQDAKRAPRAPPNGETFRERDTRIASERMAELAPGIARKHAAFEVQNPHKFIELEPQNVTAIASH